jgi:hypothetical protein
LKLNSRLPRQKQHSTKEDSFHQQVEIKSEEEIVKCYIWSIAWSGAETGTPWKVDQKCLESFEMWRWRRIEKIIWSDRVRKEVLYTYSIVKERSTQRE